MTRDLAQTTLFTEDIHDALGDVVRTIGGPKEVGRRLRPELAADDAGNWVKDCLNPKRRERFNPQQVVWLIREGKRAGCHSILHFICDDAGYTRPTPVEPIDEAAELQRQAIAAVNTLQELAPRLERLLGIKVAR